MTTEQSMPKFARIWLISILPFFPFQINIAQILGQFSNTAAMLVRFVDEFTIVVFFPLAVLEFYRNKNKFNKAYLSLIVSISIFSIFGLISGLMNRNPIFITFLGIFDYFKNFLVIFIYTAFFNYKDDFKRIFRILIVTAVFIGVIAFIQEYWAIFSRYFMGKSIYDKGVYLFRILFPSSQAPWEFRDFWRMGIYRAPSLLNHPNSVGFYTLLILTLYLYTSKKINFSKFFLIFCGIFFTVSRMLYSAFIFLAGLQFFRRKRWLVIPAIPVAIFIFFMSFLPDLNIFSLMKGQEVYNEDKIFRAYAQKKALEIWKDYPLLGVGPGMFGGVVSLINPPTIYKKYNFSEKSFVYVKNFRSLDQFWPQILAETGIFGVAAFIGIFISLIITLYIFKGRSSNFEIRDLFTGLIVIVPFILIFSLGSGFNITAFLFNYFALLGISLRNENSTY